MNSIQIRNKLSASHQGQASALFPLIKSRTHKNTLIPQPDIRGVFWTAQWWKLHQSKTFNTLSARHQQSVLQACSRMLLNEAYFIEKSGLAYCAKMVLLAETTDTAQLYAIIGADEAKHLAWIEPYVSEADKNAPYGEFLAFLSQLIETAPGNTLVYLVQIILEGWGLDHYQRMANGCLDQGLRDTLTSIVKDEALHHKGGQMVFDTKALSSQDKIEIEKALKTYCDMVRVGPVSLLNAVSNVKGPLTQDEILEIYTAVEHPSETARKLQLLKSLMQQPGLEAIIGQLESQDYFKPMLVDKVSEWYQSQG